MELQHLVWSATTCDFPGAGLYLGLAPSGEHASVARRFSPRQVRISTHGTVKVRHDGPPWPLNYFAVRDPSIVRVVPLDKPPLPNGFRHVKLHFQFDNAAPGAHDESGRVVPEANPEISAAFVLTIGLPLAREDEFFAEAIGNWPAQDWGDVYRRLREMGRR